MGKITQKDKRRMLIWSLLIVIIISYLAVFSIHYWSQILSNRKEKIKLETDYNELLKKEQDLKSQITKLQDPEYMAKYAREKYLYSKKDEIIIKIED